MFPILLDHSDAKEVGWKSNKSPHSRPCWDTTTSYSCAMPPRHFDVLTAQETSYYKEKILEMYATRF